MHNTSTEYKQVHNQTISWNDNWIFIFICLVGRLLEPSASTASFLIQILKWIRGSSWVESFIFLIAWAIFFESWELDLQLLPSSLLLLWVDIFLMCILPRVYWRNHFLLAHIRRMNESHDLGRPFKVVITISYSCSIASS